MPISISCMYKPLPRLARPDRSNIKDVGIITLDNTQIRVYIDYDYNLIICFPQGVEPFDIDFNYIDGELRIEKSGNQTEEIFKYSLYVEDGYTLKVLVYKN